MDLSGGGRRSPQQRPEASGVLVLRGDVWLFYFEIAGLPDAAEEALSPSAEFLPDNCYKQPGNTGIGTATQSVDNDVMTRQVVSLRRPT